MLHRSLVVAGEVGYHKPHVAKKILERSATYTHNSNLQCVHYHKEMNYRKKPLGWKAYSKENMDIWGEAMNPLPWRHAETKFPGIWMGCGHHNPKQWGWAHMFVARKWWCITYGGSLVPLLTYWKRMNDNGFEQKNMGAVFGMD
jgi:hypothetical protein